MAYNLYSLLPEIMRITAEMSRGSSSEENVLKRIIDIIDEEAEVTGNEIAGVAALNDPLTCPMQFLPFIAALTGIIYSPGWSDEKKRLFVNAAGALWRIKGCQMAWKAILEAHGYTRYFPWELWKTTPYEFLDYSLWEDYNRIKAARVDIRRPEDTTGDSGLLLDELVEMVRPAHVLLRRPGTDSGEADEITSYVNDVGYDGQPSITMEQHGDIVDAVQSYDDSGEYTPGQVCGAVGLEIAIACTYAACETACQGSCTTGCETTCQYGACETDCQLACQLACMVSCEFSCTTTCEATCEDVGCQTLACQVGCQVACQPGVE